MWTDRQVSDLIFRFCDLHHNQLVTVVVFTIRQRHVIWINYTTVLFYLLLIGSQMRNLGRIRLGQTYISLAPPHVSSM